MVTRSYKGTLVHIVAPYINMKLILLVLNLASLCLLSGVDPASICSETEQQDHPVLCHMLQRSHHDSEAFVRDAMKHAQENGLLVGDSWVAEMIPALSVVETTKKSLRRRRLDDKQLPVVFAHGMGDSCFNRGMQHASERASSLLGGVYSTCIPTGKDQAEDTKSGYFLNMDASVGVFAAGVAKDPNLKNGFHAIGFSQGNNVIRGYIAKCNDPPVHTFISVNGVNAGEGALPQCRPTVSSPKGDSITDSGVTFDFCEFLMEQASKKAYTEFAQNHSFQANYWRDPRPSMFPTYQKFSQLAKWNNEAGFINQTLVENWSKTQAFVWILATEDSMVWPKEGEHWGAPDPADPYHHVLPMEETEWYKKDLFGLRTAQEQNKNFFESFQADHLQFPMEDFDRWIQTYFKND